jgi:serine/threonine-protein kinase RsbW
MDPQTTRADTGTEHGVPVYHAEFEATLDEVSRVCSEFHTLAQARAGVEWAAHVDLGLTEALSNVVRHGYGPSRQGRMSLGCTERGKTWLMTVQDRGSPIPRDLLDRADGSVFDFDPEDVQSIPEGGMGLALIRSCFDELDYEDGADGNRLLLVKHIEHPAA